MTLDFPLEFSQSRQEEPREFYSLDSTYWQVPDKLRRKSFRQAFK